MASAFRRTPSGPAEAGRHGPRASLATSAPITIDPVALQWLRGARGFQPSEVRQQIVSQGAVFQTTGVAVFRGGLKNGVLTTVAGTRWRTASTVTSISSAVPSAK